MNKALIISLLNAYMYINNDDCLSIMTYNHVYNDCHIQNIEFNFVDIIDNHNKSYSIVFDDIIGIQFQNNMAIVGMK
ncbi:hypothetical protein [Phocaeicola coprophilus]|uniref:hypothetical protein n=1 Tax=Phocaeicola coprophilus TaxID=387090 RepID=UPI0030772E2D